MASLPFISKEEWEPNGFIGEVEEGFNYSWILIQESLNFISRDSTLLNCSLYYSTRKRHLFLVKPESYEPCIWNIKDLSFKFYPQSPDFLEVINGDKLFHLYRVSPNFIKILIKYQKIPHDDFEKPFAGENLHYEDASGLIPSAGGESGIGIVSPKAGNLSDLNVVLTESDKNRTRVLGKISITETSFKVVGDIRVDIKFADIVNIQKVEMLTSFIVIYMKDSRRFEISFKDGNQADVEAFFQTLQRSTGK